MDAETLANLAIPVTFVLLAILERAAPARPLPRVSGWKLKGVGFFLLTGLLSALAPLLWTDWMMSHRLLDLSRLGTVGGAALAFFVFELIGYAVHRAMHDTAIWRIHQMHHSAERVDMFGATYFHPAEIVITALVGSVASVLLLGVTVGAGALAGYAMVFCALLQHANVRTPRWLGYLVQRPEAHSLHHARGVHRYNYANLPIVDMLFGTFRNPSHFETEAGFWDGASRQVGAMLALRDVSGDRGPALEIEPARRAA
jgi:sterol desaturase/sphingolipid hydroxylase (fatty acid hydroxylase superfamily)